MKQQSAEQLYSHLVELHDQTLKEGRVELAYHVLAAALHAAEELGSLERLVEIGHMAEAGQAELDQMTPEHRLSTSAAHRRGNTPQYTALTAIAAAARGRIAADRALIHGRGARSRP